MDKQMILWLTIVGFVMVAFLFKALRSLGEKHLGALITMGYETEQTKFFHDEDYDLEDDYEWQDYINM